MKQDLQFCFFPHLTVPSMMNEALDYLEMRQVCICNNSVTILKVESSDSKRTKNPVK